MVKLGPLAPDVLRPVEGYLQVRSNSLLCSQVVDVRPGYSKPAFRGGPAGRTLAPLLDGREVVRVRGISKI
jgi:hypothetical protein